MRCLSVMIVFGLLMVPMLALAPDVQGYYNYDQSNDTDVVPGVRNVLFAMDFSQEDIGFFEIAHKSNYGQTNRTIDVYNAGDEQGKCLRLNITYDAAMSGSYNGGWHIGHVIDSGTVYLEYKLKLTNTGASTSGGSIIFMLGRSFSSVNGYYSYYDAAHSASAAQFNTLDNYLYKYNGAVVSYSGAELFDTWVNVTTVVDLDNAVSSIYFNGELAATKACAVSSIDHFFIEMSSLLAPDRFRQALIDDICLYTLGHELSVSAAPEPQLTSIGWTFDDGNATIYNNVFPKLRAAQMEANIAIVPSWIGNAGYMTWEMVEEMATSGWEVMSHSMTHADMTTLTVSQIREQMVQSKNAIVENTSVSSVSGFVFPSNKYNALALSVGWDEFDYLSASGYDIADRPSMATTGSTMAAMYKLTSTILCTKYSYGGHLHLYSHAVFTNATGSNIDLDAWNYYIDRLIENNSRLITHYDAILTRNANVASVSGNATEFSIEYPTDVGNFRNSSVWAHIAGNFSEDTYVAVSDGDIIDIATPTDGNLTMLLESGEYRILTLAEYRSEQLTEAISPIFAIIPLVIIVSVIPMVMGLGKKLK